MLGEHLFCERRRHLHRRFHNGWFHNGWLYYRWFNDWRLHYRRLRYVQRSCEFVNRCRLCKQFLHLRILEHRLEFGIRFQQRYEGRVYPRHELREQIRLSHDERDSLWCQEGLNVRCFKPLQDSRQDFLNVLPLQRLAVFFQDLFGERGILCEGSAWQRTVKNTQCKNQKTNERSFFH